LHGLARMKLLAACLAILALPACAASEDDPSPFGNPNWSPTPQARPPLTPDGEVRITLRDPSSFDHAVVADAPVVIAAPDGSIRGETRTDAEGHATGHIQAGDSVSTVIHHTGNHLVYTVVALQPGDDLQLGASALPTVGHVDVTLPAIADAVEYQLGGPCGVYVTGTSTRMEIDSDCARDPLTLYAVAYDRSNTALGYLTAENVPYVDGGAIEMTGPWRSFDTFDTLHVEMLNPPTDTTPRIVYQNNEISFSTQFPLEGTLDGDLRVQRLPGGVVETSLSDDGPVRYGTQSLRHRLDAGETSYAIDATASQRAWLRMPTFDSATSTLQIEELGAPDYDAYQATIFVDAPMGHLLEWNVYSPQAGAVVLPALPDDFGEVPRAGDSASWSDARAVHVEGASWDTLRADLPDTFDVWRLEHTFTGDVSFASTSF
jgi:hypothetical protein